MANSSELFQNLRKYIKGQIDKYELESSDSSLDYVNTNQTKGLSDLVFEFKDVREFLTTLGLGDDDIWFYQAIMNPYESFSFRDPELIEEDFYNGYIIFYDLNDENTEKLQRILKVVDPAYDYSNLGNEETNIRAAKILNQYFEKETDRIIDDWAMENDVAATKSAREYIESEVGNLLAKHDFELSRYSSVKIKAVDLINNYLLTGKIWLSFKNLFKEIFNPNDEDTREIGGWDENRYEFEGNIDKESFNREVDIQLDKMEEKLESLENLQEYVSMVDRVSSKFKPGITYPLPKLKGVQFRIKNFDRENMKIEVTLRSGLKTTSKKLSEQDFYKLLYQPELFASEFGHMGNPS